MTLFDGHLPPPADLHCHLDQAGGYPAASPDARLLAVTNDPAAWHALAGTARPHVAWALGLHPCELRRDDDRATDLLKSLPECDAIGEVGLDYSNRARASPREQRRVLSRILQAEPVGARIVTLHSVRATKDVVAAVQEHHVPGAILHWFLGSPAEVDAAIDADVYFSVNRAMFASKRGQAAVAEMPPNRVLAETDAPFGGAGRRPTTPGDVMPVEEKLSALWQISTHEARQRLWRNLSALEARLPKQIFTATP